MKRVQGIPGWGKYREVWLILGAGLAGLLVGWLLIGWTLYPVRWTNTDPYDLRPEYQEAFVSMVADSYALNGDLELAKRRLRSFEEKKLTHLLKGLLTGKVGAEAGANLPRVQKLASILGLALETPATGPAAPAQALAPARLGRVLRIGGILAFSLLALGIIAAVVVRLRLRREEEVEEEHDYAPRERLEFVPSPSAQASSRALVTTYSLGDDSYDTSFSIESSTGEFLGECGMGISEVLGQGPPEKVTALEVWLFDKADIRTVTQLLLSEYAFRDDTLRARLAPKGEAVLAEKGTILRLESDTLELEAEVTELEYGQDDLPFHSFFERITVELRPRAKGKSVF